MMMTWKIGGMTRNVKTPAIQEVRALESTLRFLVSNNFAGSVIGKAGQVISEFQVQSGAKIVMSRAHEFFPGTADRIVLISGTVSAILTALHLILSKLADDPRRVETAREGELDLLRIVVPHRVCGAIIGKAGATIRGAHTSSHLPPLHLLPSPALVCFVYHPRVYSLAASSSPAHHRFPPSPSASSSDCALPPQQHFPHREPRTAPALPSTIHSSPPTVSHLLCSPSRPSQPPLYPSAPGSTLLLPVPSHLACHATTPCHVDPTPSRRSQMAASLTSCAPWRHAVADHRGRLAVAGRRSFVEDSQATIKLSSQDTAGPGFAERLITIGGSLEQKLRAVALLLTKMSEDPTYVQYADVPLSYTGEQRTIVSHVPRSYVDTYLLHVSLSSRAHSRIPFCSSRIHPLPLSPRASLRVPHQRRAGHLSRLPLRPRQREGAGTRAGAAGFRKEDGAGRAGTGAEGGTTMGTRRGGAAGSVAAMAVVLGTGAEVGEGVGAEAMGEGTDMEEGGAEAGVLELPMQRLGDFLRTFRTCVARWECCGKVGVLWQGGRAVARWECCGKVGVLWQGGRAVARWECCGKVGVVWQGGSAVSLRGATVMPLLPCSACVRDFVWCGPSSPVISQAVDPCRAASAREGPPPLPPGGGVPTTIIVAVPDDHVGAVVGKGGKSLHEIQQSAGVRMLISDRNDYVEGTRNRKVTITGPSEGVVAAQHLIAQKVQQSIASASGDRLLSAPDRLPSTVDRLPPAPPRGFDAGARGFDSGARGFDSGPRGFDSGGGRGGGGDRLAAVIVLVGLTYGGHLWWAYFIRK
ncbi:unnamed protein product [Closterium sp. NIES-65]|nr:unnamed protein product [Closterium sp. NIES-65]